MQLGMDDTYIYDVPEIGWTAEVPIHDSASLGLEVVFFRERRSSEKHYSNY